jgi:peptide/nickel transport system substrate-binding protein
MPVFDSARVAPACSIRQLAGVALLSGFILSACTPASPPTVPPAAPSNGQAPAAQPATLKSITLLGTEVVDNFWMFGATGAEHSGFLDAGFVGTNPATTEVYPWLAEEVPSVEKGTWTIDAAASTMVTTIHLRPGLVWQDGTPYQPQDFVFGWQVATDPKVPINDKTTANQIASIDTPDDRTIIIHWKSLYSKAATFQKLEVRHLPRHIMESVYRDAVASGDYSHFENHPYFTREFVGMGPYKLTSYTDTTEWTLEAFDRYALGRPKIDRIHFRLITDANALVTELLAGTADVAFGSIGQPQALALRQQWEPTGKGAVSINPLSSRYLAPSLNPWLQDPQVRRALLEAIDRESINHALFADLSQVMNMPLSPREPRFAAADATAVKYPYDPQQANQLLDAAGWQRAADGVRVNGQGDRMVIEYRAVSGDREQEAIRLAVRDFWSQVGVGIDIQNVTSQQSRDPAYRNRWAGVAQLGGNVNVAEWELRWHTRNVPTEANRWTGNNPSRWSNPQADAILDELGTVNLARPRQDDLVMQFVKLWTDQVPALPLVYNTDIVPVATRVTGIVPRSITGINSFFNWNVHEWDVR